MKPLYYIILFLFCITSFDLLNAQHTLKVVNKRGGKSYSYLIGDKIKIKQFNSRSWDEGRIEEIHEKYFVMNKAYIAYDEIARIYIEPKKRKNNLIQQGPVIAIGGALYLGFDVVNGWRRTDEFEVAPNTGLVSGALVAIGLLLPQLKKSDLKVGKKWKIITI